MVARKSTKSSKVFGGKRYLLKFWVDDEGFYNPDIAQDKAGSLRRRGYSVRITRGSIRNGLTAVDRWLVWARRK